ncbi:MAG: sulfotransferase [Sedimentitalea sp.]
MLSKPKQDAVSLPRISLVSTARSGTTHLIRIAAALEQLYVVRNEWLDMQGVAWAQADELAKFRALHGVDYTDHTDPRLSKWVRENKEETLQILETLAKPEDRAVFYKSFPGHVLGDDFNRLFYDRPGTLFVFLMRRPIDSFISLMKARSIEKWVTIDTTQMKPELQAESFLTWWGINSDWFLRLQQRLKADNRPFGMLSYEDDVMASVPHLLNRLVAELHVAGFETSVNRTHLVKSSVKRAIHKVKGRELFGDMGAMKQDKEKSTAAKVSNWDAFCQDVIARTGSLDSFEAFKPQDQPHFWGAKGCTAKF